MSDLREPPKTMPPINSGRDLDWSMARKAAEAIIKQCDDACFTPPECADIHAQRVGIVCRAMDAIVDALRLRGPK